jgi:cobalt-zinc-cadmium efflux system protein
MIGDVVGSMGAIAAGVIILATGWKYADPLFAAGVGLLILPRAWSLLKAALDVLLEGAPAHIAIPDVQQVMLQVTGVQSVHDLHVWTVTSGFVALSGHVQGRRT